jgi:hypothetical protein
VLLTPSVHRSITCSVGNDDPRRSLVGACAGVCGDRCGDASDVDNDFGKVREMSNVQSGPCIVCGLTNYPLSCGGPSICPTCDCGNFGPQLVERQRKEIERLRAQLGNSMPSMTAALGENC